MAQKNSSDTVKLRPEVMAELERFKIKEGVSHTEAASVGTWWYIQQPYEKRDRMRQNFLKWVDNYRAAQIQSAEDAVAVVGVADKADAAEAPQPKPPKKRRKKKGEKDVA